MHAHRLTRSEAGASVVDPYDRPMHSRKGHDGAAAEVPGTGAADGADHRNGQFRRSGSRWRFAALLFLLCGLGAAAAIAADGDLLRFADRSNVSGPVAPLIATGAVALLLAAMIPRSVVAAGAGLLFGTWHGAGYVMAGAMLAAVLTFAVGRALGRDFVDTRRRAAVVNRWLDQHGLMGVFVLRLLPIAPFGLVSYAFGATRIRLRTFALATLMGIAPSTLVFATLGANALSPREPAFIVATSAALVLGAGGAAGATILRRRRAGAQGT
jgi:uncharacterized membrane protein YdjX (TVP38/TMEM64 family)